MRTLVAGLCTQFATCTTERQGPMLQLEGA